MVVDRFAARNQPHAVLQHRGSDGQWKPLAPLKWSVAAIVSVDDDADTFVAIGDLGQTAVWNGREVTFGQIERPDGRVADLGRLRAAAQIGGLVYAAGMGRTVVVREQSAWEAIDAGLRRRSPSTGPIGFEAIAGNSRANIYAAGWHGDLWQFDGSRWQERNLPTNAVITGACCTRSGTAYLVGRGGLLLRGKDATWEVVDHGVTREDFWSAAAVGETAYFSTMRALYRSENDSLALVDFGDDLPSSCYSLACVQEKLLSIGAKDVMLLCGDRWQRLA